MIRPHPRIKLIDFLDLTLFRCTLILATRADEMQLPKRVPWASLSELEELCSWIYSDETDLHTKQLAVNKVIHPLSYFSNHPLSRWN